MISAEPFAPDDEAKRRANLTALLALKDLHHLDGDEYEMQRWGHTRKLSGLDEVERFAKLVAVGAA